MVLLIWQPKQVVAAVHPKAMPVMLDQGDFGRWLDNDHEEACGLAIPFADERMEIRE